jgi:tetratricopeptide (TPR) repeat protein
LTHLGPEEAAVQADARSGLAQARAGRPVPADAPATATPGPVEPTRMRSAPGRPTPPLAQPPVGVPIRSALAQQLGWAYYQRGLFDEALGLFEQALASAPDNLRARAGRGWTLVQLRRPQAAIGELDRVIQSSEAEAWQLQEALRGRGWARYRLRDFSGAVSDFTRAFEYAGPDETGVREDLLRGRSRAWYRLGRYDLAAADIAHRAGRDGRPPAGRLAVAASVYVAALRWRLGRMARLMRPKGV